MRKLLLMTCAVSLIIPVSSPVMADGDGIMSGSVGIFACDAPGNKQKKGAIIGAVLGGVIGNKVAKDNKTIATVIGAAVGGAVGSYFGCTLQRKDQEKMAIDSEKSLALGENYQYTNAESGLNVDTVATSNTTTSNQNISLANGVAMPKSLILVGSKYITTKDTALKNSISSKAKTISKVAIDTEVEVLGQTSQTNGYAAIKSNGVIAGYIPMKDLKPLGKLNLPDANVAKNAKTVKIPVTSTCREVVQTVELNGALTDNGRVSTNACVGTDGVWKAI